MRNKIAAAKQTIVRNKVGITFVGTVTLVYVSYFGAAYCNLQTARVQYDLARIENIPTIEI